MGSKSWNNTKFKMSKANILSKADAILKSGLLYSMNSSYKNLKTNNHPSKTTLNPSKPQSLPDSQTQLPINSKTHKTTYQASFLPISSNSPSVPNSSLTFVPNCHSLPSPSPSIPLSKFLNFLISFLHLFNSPSIPSLKSINLHPIFSFQNINLKTNKEIKL